MSMLLWLLRRSKDNQVLARVRVNYIKNWAMLLAEQSQFNVCSQTVIFPFPE